LLLLVVLVLVLGVLPVKGKVVKGVPKGPPSGRCKNPSSLLKRKGQKVERRYLGGASSFSSGSIPISFGSHSLINCSLSFSDRTKLLPCFFTPRMNAYLIIAAKRTISTTIRTRLL